MQQPSRLSSVQNLYGESLMVETAAFNTYKNVTLSQSVDTGSALRYTETKDATENMTDQNQLLTSKPNSVLQLTDDYIEGSQ